MDVVLLEQMPPIVVDSASNDWWGATALAAYASIGVAVVTGFLAYFTWRLAQSAKGATEGTAAALKEVR